MLWLFAICLVILIIATKTLYDAHSEREALRAEKLRFADDLNDERKKCESELAVKRLQADQVIKQEKADLESYITEKKRSAETLIRAEWQDLDARETDLSEREAVLAVARSNLTAIPFMAGIIADYDTRGLDILAKRLDWGAQF